MIFREYRVVKDDVGSFVEVDDCLYRLGPYDAEKNALRADRDRLREQLAHHCDGCDTDEAQRQALEFRDDAKRVADKLDQVTADLDRQIEQSEYWRLAALEWQEWAASELRKRGLQPAGGELGDSAARKALEVKP